MSAFLVDGFGQVRGSVSSSAFVEHLSSQEPTHTRLFLGESQHQEDQRGHCSVTGSSELNPTVLGPYNTMEDCHGRSGQRSRALALFSFEHFPVV